MQRLFEVTRELDGYHIDGSTQFDTQTQTAMFIPFQPLDYRTAYRVKVREDAFHRTDEQEGLFLVCYVSNSGKEFLIPCTSGPSSRKCDLKKQTVAI